MKIHPILINGRITRLLSKRDLYICPKGRRSILYEKNKVYNINNNDEFSLDQGYYDVNECKLLEDSNFNIETNINNNLGYTKLNNRHFEEKPNDEVILNYPTNNTELVKLSKLGIDSAFILLSLRFNQSDKKFLELQKIRPRFQNLKFNKDNYINTKYLINDHLINFPFQYLVFPTGVGGFKNLKKTIKKNIKLIEIIKMHNTKKYIDELKVNNFKNQFYSSVFFHNEIINNFNVEQEEKGSLNYLFNNNDVLDYFLTNYRDLSSSMHLNIDIFRNDLLLRKSIMNISTECLKIFKNWKSSTFDSFQKELGRLPRKLGFNDIYLDILDKNYPKSLLKFSVYILSASSNIKNIQDKCGILHRYGLRRLIDLKLIIVLRNVFKSQKNLDHFKSFIP